MFIVGGLCFVLIGCVNEYFSWSTPLCEQALLGTLVVTVIEFIAGMVLNIWLHLGVWDYSHMPLNIMGQVCLPYSILWFLLSVPAIILDDWLRHKLFGEPIEKYVLIKGMIK